MGSLKTQWDSTVREWAHQEDDLPPGIQEFVGLSKSKTQWVEGGVWSHSVDTDPQSHEEML